VQVSHSFTPESAVFDDDNLVSGAGLVPVMTLAEQTCLADLLAEKVHIAQTRIKSGAANPAPKLAGWVVDTLGGQLDIGEVSRRNVIRLLSGKGMSLRAIGKATTCAASTARNGAGRNTSQLSHAACR
jgi:hypothetical protein